MCYFRFDCTYMRPAQRRSSSVPPEWFRCVFLNEILKVIRAEYNIQTWIHHTHPYYT